MPKSHTITLLLASLMLLPACSWMSRKPSALESELLAAMQKPAEAIDAENPTQQLPLRVDYELRQKPLRGEELLITLEIKPGTDIADSAFAVKVPEAIKLQAPAGAIGLGSLKARQTYQEQIWLTPVNEGLYEVEVYFVTKVSDSQPMIKLVRVPVSIGPFQPPRQRY